MPLPASNPSVQTSGSPISSAAIVLAHGPPTTTMFLSMLSATESSTARPTLKGLTCSPDPVPDTLVVALSGAMKTFAYTSSSGYVTYKYEFLSLSYSNTRPFVLAYICTSLSLYSLFSELAIQALDKLVGADTSISVSLESYVNCSLNSSSAVCLSESSSGEVMLIAVAFIILNLAQSSVSAT